MLNLNRNYKHNYRANIAWWLAKAQVWQKHLPGNYRAIFTQDKPRKTCMRNKYLVVYCLNVCKGTAYSQGRNFTVVMPKRLATNKAHIARRLKRLQAMATKLASQLA